MSAGGPWRLCPHWARGTGKTPQRLTAMTGTAVRNRYCVIGMEAMAVALVPANWLV